MNLTEITAQAEEVVKDHVSGWNAYITASGKGKRTRYNFFFACDEASAQAWLVRPDETRTLRIVAVIPGTGAA